MEGERSRGLFLLAHRLLVQNLHDENALSSPTEAARTLRALQ